MSARISTASTEYVKVRVYARRAGQTIDPTVDTVALAFLTTGTPQVSDWHAGTWETAGTRSYFARCLVGPAGGVVLAPGTYNVWVKVTDDPEVPVMETDTLTVF